MVEGLEPRHPVKERIRHEGAKGTRRTRQATTWRLAGAKGLKVEGILDGHQLRSRTKFRKKGEKYYSGVVTLSRASGRRGVCLPQKRGHKKGKNSKRRYREKREVLWRIPAKTRSALRRVSGVVLKECGVQGGRLRISGSKFVTKACT